MPHIFFCFSMDKAFFRDCHETTKAYTKREVLAWLSLSSELAIHVAQGIGSSPRAVYKFRRGQLKLARDTTPRRKVGIGGRSKVLEGIQGVET